MLRIDEEFVNKTKSSMSQIKSGIYRRSAAAGFIQELFQKHPDKRVYGQFLSDVIYCVAEKPGANRNWYVNMTARDVCIRTLEINPGLYHKYQNKILATAARKTQKAANRAALKKTLAARVRNMRLPDVKKAVPFSKTFFQNTYREMARFFKWLFKAAI